MAGRPTLEEYEQGVRAGSIVTLARAITLVESHRTGDIDLAQELLARLLPATGKARRVGITGVPGAGKSTFIDALGTLLIEKGHRVAVLAIDPSSSLTGGSILGDKTRMTRLARDPRAFIRPSPSSGSLGGVARKTRETMLVCEAAGFDVILVETVGVGQSETLVSGMVDFFLVLMLAGAGDELQGIKRGILELADLLAINKADGDNRPRALRARREFETALHFMRPASPHWTPPVLAISALTGEGLPELWEAVTTHAARLTKSGELPAKRQAQQVEWMWAMVRERLENTLLGDSRVRELVPRLEREVRRGTLTPARAADQILQGKTRRSPSS